MVWVRPDSADLTALGELADAGKLSVPVEATFPLAEAAEAFRRSMAGPDPRQDRPGGVLTQGRAGRRSRRPAAAVG